MWKNIFELYLQIYIDVADREYTDLDSDYLLYTEIAACE